MRKRNRERGRPQYQIVTDELDVVTKDGTALTLYGFGLERRQALIDAYRRPARIDTDPRQNAGAVELEAVGLPVGEPFNRSLTSPFSFSQL
jgi:hypothetical protein